MCREARLICWAPEARHAQSISSTERRDSKAPPLGPSEQTATYRGCHWPQGLLHTAGFCRRGERFVPDWLEANRLDADIAERLGALVELPGATVERAATTAVPSAKSQHPVAKRSRDSNLTAPSNPPCCHCRCGRRVLQITLG